MKVIARRRMWLLVVLLHIHLACVVSNVTTTTTLTADVTCRHDDWTAQPFPPPLRAMDPVVVNFQATSVAAPSVRLLIGVKSSVVHGVAARRAIRSTWANRSSLPTGVRVVFLGCVPDLSPFNDSQVDRIRDAIIAEQVQHDGDLLIDELASCRDAYDDLVSKVLAFFQWSAGESSTGETTTKSYVMVADDDIYVRVNRLLSLLTDPQIPGSRFYGGQVWTQQFRRVMEPRREPPGSRYYLSRDHYSLDVLPPFANGPHYILSTDVAHFIGQHRDTFRGVGGDPLSSDSVGTLDDVSVALWLLAMQIHPYHFDQFIGLRDTMCANDVVSFADLTPHALARMHANEQQQRSVCEGFSFRTWLMRLFPPRTERDIQDDPRRLAVWNTLEMTCQGERLSHTDDLEVFIVVRSKNEPSREPVELKFVPARDPFFVFCWVLTERIAEGLGVLAGQPVFICEQVRTTLRQLMMDNVVQYPRKRPLGELLVHNLESDVVTPQLKVVMAANTAYARVVVENLLVQAYDSVELQVFDEATYGEADRDPDIVFFTTAEASAKALVGSFVHKYKRSRLVLLHPRDVSAGEHERVLLFASTRVGAMIRPSLYLPLASTAFGSSTKHSPMDLVLSFDTRERSSRTSSLPTPTARMRSFCIDDYVPHQCDHPHRQYFSQLLNALDSVDIAGACPRHVSRSRGVVGNHMLNESITTTSTYALDRKVDRFANYKFAIAFEDAVNAPGHVGDAIVAAFLAGSVPIYYGHSETISSLFNAKAFIDCGAFASLRVCAKHVLAVHASPSLFEAMRREVPVLNTTAFYEAFSWHPDVAEMIKKARTRDNTVELLTVSEQFKRQLDSV